MSETFSKVEVITGVARRQWFTTQQKLLVVSETLQPGMSTSYVARRHGLSPSLVKTAVRPSLSSFSRSAGFSRVAVMEEAAAMSRGVAATHLRAGLGPIFQKG
ncbi:MAG: transposase [Bradyrhizobium sp.]|uniref:transposase n=1 Tax=Bradyrhizobium sp. TaxID=376 RepID=UPI003D0E47AA